MMSSWQFWKRFLNITLDPMSIPSVFNGVKMMEFGSSKMSRYSTRLHLIHSNQVNKTGMPSFSSQIWFSFKPNWLSWHWFSHSELIVNKGFDSDGYESGRVTSISMGTSLSHSIVVCARFPEIDRFSAGLFGSRSSHLLASSRSTCSIGSHSSTFIGRTFVSIGTFNFKTVHFICLIDSSQSKLSYSRKVHFYIKFFVVALRSFFQDF